MSYTPDGHLEGVVLSRSELFKQATETAADLFVSIEADMKDRKGKEWAEAHPEAIAQLAVAAAVDFNEAMKRIRLQEIESKLQAVASMIETLHP